jgi:hypothetical protein
MLVLLTLVPRARCLVDFCGERNMNTHTHTEGAKKCIHILRKEKTVLKL